MPIGTALPVTLIPMSQRRNQRSSSRGRKVGERPESMITTKATGRNPVQLQFSLNHPSPNCSDGATSTRKID